MTDNYIQQLALGLEVTDRPFLWVVQPDLAVDSADASSDDFKDRVRNRGMMVAWAPQQKVLTHPSVGCFVSHCGWNSTLEGVRNGKLFLCWPYFADQFLNHSYICGHWKVGLILMSDESGIVKHEQLKSKVEELLGDAEMSARASSLKEKAQRNTDQGGGFIPQSQERWRAPPTQLPFSDIIPWRLADIMMRARATGLMKLKNAEIEAAAAKEMASIGLTLVGSHEGESEAA
ncbi:UDP-glycosyltransferase 83A1-like [Zingiber officinale]|uniref:UDP-glycosyltransferase 83A1-like n=1 Tax=Zingiber officinale TaxID=94328 RepID=UPI001C4BBF56|nr:UDP-glycosyltransferase 83A1-like [Zingiber officinale]